MKKGIPFALRTETPADIADFVNNNFREIFEERVGGYTLEELDDRYLNDNAVVQVVHSQESSYATGTTQIPQDDTIPQNTEGDEYLSVSITPRNSKNILMIEALVSASVSGNTSITMALFKNADSGAIASTWNYVGTNEVSQLYLKHQMIANTTNQITFKIRCGPSGAVSLYINGYNGNRYFGGTMVSFITVTEYSA